MTTRSNSRSSRGLRALVIPLITGFALVAAACGGDDGDGGSAPTGDAPATTAAPAEHDDNGAPPDNGDNGVAPDDGDDPVVDPASGGVLRYAYYLNPSRFDPHRSTVGQDIRLFIPVYDRLVHYDAAGELIGGLATDWEFTEDGTAIVMQIREGAVFHDGETLDAEVVKANLERGQTVEGSSVVSDLESITEIEVTGEYEVTLRLEEPNALLLAFLSSRAGVMVSPAAFDNEDLDFEPVGAGPYRVTDYRVDDIIVYERFEDHWDENYGGPDRIEVRVFSDETTRLNALRSGEVDVAFLTGTQIDEAERAGFEVDARPTLTYQVVYLNRSKAGLDNELIRQAMQYAIDREAFVRVVLNDAGIPAVQPFPPEYFAHNPDFPADHYPYDPDRARELMAEAGVTDRIEMELLVPNVTDRIVGAELVQAWMADIGIDMTVRQFEASQAGDIFFAREEGVGMQSQWGGRIDPQMTMDLQTTPGAFLNAGDHTTDRYMELSAQARTTLDPDERNAILQEMVAEIVDQAFTLIIAHDFIVHGVADNVVNFSLLAGGEMDFGVMSVED